MYVRTTVQAMHARGNTKISSYKVLLYAATMRGDKYQDLNSHVLRIYGIPSMRRWKYDEMFTGIHNGPI